MYEIHGHYCKCGRRLIVVRIADDSHRDSMIPRAKCHQCGRLYTAVLRRTDGTSADDGVRWEAGSQIVSEACCTECGRFGLVPNVDESFELTLKCYYCGKVFDKNESLEVHIPAIVTKED